MARGGLGWQTRASNPNLAQGRKVKLRTEKQLFAALLGMQEQRRVAGIGAGATGSSALRRRLLMQPVRLGLCQEKWQPFHSWAPPLQHAATGMLGFSPCSAAVNLPPCTGGTNMKKVPSLGQTDSVCQAEPLHGSTGLANTQATLVGVRDFLSPVPQP